MGQSSSNTLSTRVFQPPCCMDDWSRRMLHAVEPKLRFITKANGERLSYLFIDAPAPPRRATSVWSVSAPEPLVILMSHGNAEDLGLCHEYLRYLSQTLGVAVMGYDYCGYGFSGPLEHQHGGVQWSRRKYITEEVVEEDADLIYHHLQTRYGFLPRQIVVMGRSLGGGPSCYLAKHYHDEVGGVILESTFTSILAVLGLPLLTACLHPIDLFHNKTMIMQATNCPLLIIHGNDDRVVPFKCGVQLVDAAKKSRRGVLEKKKRKQQRQQQQKRQEATTPTTITQDEMMQRAPLVRRVTPCPVRRPISTTTTAKSALLLSETEEERLPTPSPLMLPTSPTHLTATTSSDEREYQQQQQYEHEQDDEDDENEVELATSSAAASPVSQHNNNSNNSNNRSASPYQYAAAAAQSGGADINALVGVEGGGGGGGPPPADRFTRWIADRLELTDDEQMLQVFFQCMDGCGHNNIARREPTQYLSTLTRFLAYISHRNRFFGQSPRIATTTTHTHLATPLHASARASPITKVPPSPIAASPATNISPPPPPPTEPMQA